MNRVVFYHNSLNSNILDVVHRNVCRLVNTIPVVYSFTVSKRNHNRPNLIENETDIKQPDT